MSGMTEIRRSRESKEILMNKKLSWLLAIIFGVMVISQSQAEITTKPQTPDEARFVALTRAMEKDPFTVDKTTNSWMLNWAIASPDVRVDICARMLGPAFEEKPPYTDSFLMLYMFGNAAHQIEHPEDRNDQIALQTAAMESVLKAYVVVIGVHPDATIPYYDNLLAKQANGTLKETLTPLVADACKKS
jgi:hypothetical protein